jgi:hypothetical protein
MILKINIIGRVLAILIITLSVTSVSTAKAVYVKYQGNVSLDSFNCKNTSSSFVNKICYKQQDSYIVVLLGNTYYHYCRVPSPVVKSWLGASSKGSYYHSNIKGRFDCRLGGIPK